MSIKLALITEEFDGEIEKFETEAEVKAFQKGFAMAGESYGAGHCKAYTKEEAEMNLDGEEKDQVLDALEK